MITARTLGCINAVRKLYRPGFKNYVQSIRKSSHGHGHEHDEIAYYREVYKGPDGGRSHELIADVLGGFMWWWIMWHIFTQPEMLFGEFPEIDQSKWTDEELGIPPDEE